MCEWSYDKKKVRMRNVYLTIHTTKVATKAHKDPQMQVAWSVLAFSLHVRLPIHTLTQNIPSAYGLKYGAKPRLNSFDDLKLRICGRAKGGVFPPTLPHAGVSLARRTSVLRLVGVVPWPIDVKSKQPPPSPSESIAWPTEIARSTCVPSRSFSSHTAPRSFMMCLYRTTGSVPPFF